MFFLISFLNFVVCYSPIFVFIIPFIYDLYFLSDKKVLRFFPLAEQRNLLSPGVRSRVNSFYSDGGLLSPGGGARESGVGLRESGDVEGVRLQNNLYVSGDISEADAEQWRNRRLIPNNTLFNEV